MNEVINGDSLIAVVGQFRRELVEVFLEELNLLIAKGKISENR